MLGQLHDYITVMNRVPLAVIGGILGLFVYLAAATVLADSVVRLHWTIQALYFVIAGMAWVGPVRWLMLWSVHRRG